MKNSVYTELCYQGDRSLNKYINHLLSIPPQANSVQSAVAHDGYRGADLLTWGTVRVFGATATSVMVNGKSHSDFNAPYPGVRHKYCRSCACLACHSETCAILKQVLDWHGVPF